MQQIARNVTMDGWGILGDCRCLLHDRDTKTSERSSNQVTSKPYPCPHGLRSVKDECLSKIIPFGERSLRRAMKDYVAHYHTERNHQGKNNVLLFHRSTKTKRDKRVLCRERLRGLLRYYHREAARILGQAPAVVGLPFNINAAKPRCRCTDAHRVARAGSAQILSPKRFRELRAGRRAVAHQSDRTISLGR